MSVENFDPSSLKGVSVNTVFKGEADADNFTPQIQKRFSSLEQNHLSDSGEPNLLYDIATAAAEGMSLRAIATKYGLGRPSLTKLFKVTNIAYGTREEAVKRWNNSPQGKDSARASIQAARAKVAENPELSQQLRRNHGDFMQKRWEDPEFREHISASTSKTFTRLWQDPEYRERMKVHTDNSRRLLAKLKQRASYRKRMSEIQRERWEDPEFREKISERTRRNHPILMQAQRELRRNPSHRDKLTTELRQRTLALWQDPEFTALQKERHKAKWQDPEYREKMLKIILNPDRKTGIPSIHGFRSDVGYYALSTWEANIARMLKLVGRDYLTKVEFKLYVTDEHRDIFDALETTFFADFLTVDNRGRTIIYEIMAHPFENPDGWAKLELAKLQHPEIIIRAIDRNMYRRLQRNFKDKINQDQRFSGWEKYGYNLRTHPEIFT